MIPIVLFQSLWMFSVWLVFTSNLNSQTTWLKLKLKLTHFPSTSSLTSPLMSFAALPDSYSIIMFTPFAMRQLLGITCLPRRATAEANDNIQDEQHVQTSCLPVHSSPDGLSAENSLLHSLKQDLMMCLLS